MDTVVTRAEFMRLRRGEGWDDGCMRLESLGGLSRALFWSPDVLSGYGVFRFDGRYEGCCQKHDYARPPKVWRPQIRNLKTY